MYHLTKRYLITCDDWFLAPDGIYYKAVFGTLISLENAPQVLGITVNARSMDWFMTIGNKSHMKIAGCRIHYAIETDECNLNPVNPKSEDETSPIFNADF